ncbi:MAG: hypothetical protein KME23_17700 [Goleter apudmare HA4340-LM2]|jgi:hypothetical protein|nr:hypothetical protein [Goleter apudmare HA4340-LM2]MBW4644796.1 hypothetical protein [Goleter apudmare HA4340-LM2]
MTTKQVNSQIDEATLFTGMKLCELIAFMKELDPELDEVEVTVLTGVFLEKLPRLISESPRFMATLKYTANKLKRSRNQSN